MASVTLNANHSDDEPKETTLKDHTFEDDVTEAAGSNRGKNEAVEVERNVKWQMPGHHDASSAKKRLQQLLAYLLIYLPGDVTIIDGKQREWSYKETDDEEKFRTECEHMSVQVHPIKNREQRIIRWVAITRVHSITTVQDWKYNDHFYSIVDEAETYIFPHPFAYDQWVNKFDQADQPTPTDLLHTMTQDAQLWNDLLWASGGALEPSKCSFHLIQTDWNTDGHPFLKGGILQTPIMITHDDNSIPTWQMSNYTSHKTLGCYINPAHSQNQTWKVAHNKNLRFAQLIESNYFTRSEAWTMYVAVYLPSMLYPLQITPLAQRQCQSLDARFLRALIPRCGYNRNMAKEIRYGSCQMGGAGFRQIYVEQGALLLQQLYKWFNSPQSQIGQILLMTVSWTQAFVGTSKMFLTYPNQELPPVGPSFLIDTLQFLRRIQGSISVHHFAMTKPLRQNDQFIMDIAISQQRWKPKQLTQINACRRFLQAQTFEDITIAQGTRFQRHVRSGFPIPPANTIKISTLNQQKPGKAAWKTWQGFLRTISDKSGTLTHPLGQWIVPHTETRHWSPHVYDATQDRLYSHDHNQYYKEHPRLSPHVFAIQPHPTITVAQGHPTAVTIMMDRLIPTCNFANTPPTVAEPLPEWEKDVLRHHKGMTIKADVRQAVASGTIVMCSDGLSTKEGGTFGFIVSSLQGKRLVCGHGQAHGDYNNSFRSEAYGILATVTWLKDITSGMRIGQRTITHYLDNKSVIQRINKSLEDKWQLPN